MPAWLTLIAHGATPATRRVAFAIDEELDVTGREAASGAPRLTHIVDSRCSPAAAARETAHLLDLTATVDEELRDWDLGRWAGRTLEDVATLEPDAATIWLTDPNAAPHDGEPLDAVLDRVASWLEDAAVEGHRVAVTHSAVVRAAFVHALNAPASAFWRIDVPPLGRLVLSGRPGSPAVWSVKRFDVLDRRR